MEYATSVQNPPKAANFLRTKATILTAAYKASQSVSAPPSLDLISCYTHIHLLHFSHSETLSLQTCCPTSSSPARACLTPSAPSDVLFLSYRKTADPPPRLISTSCFVSKMLIAI